MKKRILVTGADGFIGRRLVKALEDAGKEVFTHSLTDGDIADKTLCYSNIDHVFHMAALTYVPESWNDPKSFYRVNVMGTQNVLELCRENSASVTFMSTYVYGPPQYLPIDEIHPIAPNSPYNHSKYLAEDLCRFYHEAFSVGVAVFRPFNIFGYGQAPHFLIPEIVSQILDPNKSELKLMSLTPKRDYIYVDDVVEALLLSIDHAQGFDAFNIASGITYSVLDIAKSAMKICGIEKPIISAGIDRKNEVTDIRANVEKAKRLLDWSPTFSFEDGLKDMVEQWREHEKN